ncbi:hypothetical protein DFQ30_008678 [Apophysomyces sp. BC1015]|nr:hypothetical protein DFQ30_008678 [Apophysomyces sp. BC1015]
MASTKELLDDETTRADEETAAGDSMSTLQDSVPALYQVRATLHVSSTTINSTISLYVFTLGVAPMMWAALSERYGRRLIYLGATAIYLGATIGCAVSNQFPIFVIMRIFQAIGASAAQAVGAGTITDLFPVNKRGNAMGLFFLGPLIGPVVGPIAGGYINQYLGWKYIFWTLAGMGGLILLLMVIFLPETSPAILRPTAAREAGTKTFIRPFRFLARPLVILASLPYAMAYGFMYFIIATLPHQLDYRYGFTSSQIGLAYLANGIGNALGAVVSGRYTDWMMNRIVQDGDKKTSIQMAKTPEMRLSVMWLGILLLPLGELIYGWCIQFRIHVAAALSGLFLRL